MHLFVFRVLSRDSPDVHETSVLMVFQQKIGMFASHERAHGRASKKQRFRPRKSTLDAPKRRPGEPRTLPDRCDERPNHPDARRPTENLAKERSQGSSNAVSSPWSRCKSARCPNSPKTGLVILNRIYTLHALGGSRTRGSASTRRRPQSTDGQVFEHFRSYRAQNRSI